jgi:hypothetical protein
LNSHVIKPKRQADQAGAIVINSAKWSRWKAKMVVLVHKTNLESLGPARSRNQLKIDCRSDPEIDRRSIVDQTQRSTEGSSFSNPIL